MIGAAAGGTAGATAGAAFATISLLAALAAGAPSPAPADGGSDAPPPAPFIAKTVLLGAFPLESQLGRPLFAGPAQVTLRFDATQARASNELTRRLRITIAADGSLVLAFSGYPGARDKPVKQHLQPSFLIDFDDPRFRPLLDEARAKLGAAPSVERLVAFVDRAITKKGWGRGFDIASVVALRREGDCTEHAVLLTALARAFHLPARVVEGLVLLEVEGKTVAFGHAWSEVRVGAAWQPADAALPGPDPRLYLPLDLISDESPSYGLSLTTSGAGTLGVRRVIVGDRR